MKTLKVINWRSMGWNDRAKIVVEFFQQFFELEDFNSEMSYKYKYFINGDCIGITVDGEYYEVDLSCMEATDNEKTPETSVWAEKLIELTNPLPEVVYNIWLDWSIHPLSSKELREWNNGIREYVIGKDLFESPEQAFTYKETMKNPNLEKVWILYKSRFHKSKLVIGKMEPEKTSPDGYYGRVSGKEYSLQRSLDSNGQIRNEFKNTEEGFILPISFESEKEALDYALRENIVPVYNFVPKNWENEDSSIEDIREEVHSWGEYHD